MASSSVLVLLPASIRKIKDIILAIALMLPLLIKHSSHYFIIAGSVRDQAYYEETITFLNQKLKEYEDLHPNLHIKLRERVKIIDFLLHPDYLSVLREASLVLNTSVSEGMSGSILEAFGAKVPVLARKNDGNCFLVQNGVNGGVFETSSEFEEWYEILVREGGGGEGEGEEEGKEEGEEGGNRKDRWRREMVENAWRRFKEEFSAEREEERILKLVDRVKEKYFKRVSIGKEEYFLLNKPNVHQISEENTALFSVQ